MMYSKCALCLALCSLALTSMPAIAQDTSPQATKAALCIPPGSKAPVACGTAKAGQTIRLQVATTDLPIDPINLLFGRPSILRDWSNGRWGRTLALGAGGLLCGFLWEFWNFWAGTKWVYHLPFLGSWEHVKYFEMPIPGLLGFIAFGIETWTMWQTSLLILSPFVEGEKNTAGDEVVAKYGCI